MSSAMVTFTFVFVSCASAPAANPTRTAGTSIARSHRAVLCRLVTVVSICNSLLRLAAGDARGSRGVALAHLVHHRDRRLQHVHLAAQGIEQRLARGLAVRIRPE